jgi:hypothetical protein
MANGKGFGPFVHENGETTVKQVVRAEVVDKGEHHQPMLDPRLRAAPIRPSLARRDLYYKFAHPLPDNGFRSR